MHFSRFILFSFVLFSFFLVACSTTPLESETQTKTPDIQSEIIAEEHIAEMGESCGGEENILCKSSFECVVPSNNAFDEGTCIRSGDKNVSCDPIEKPVCGLKNGRKNGYMNACEAERHRAEIVSEGFCKTTTIDQNNLCESTTEIIGNCPQLHTAYEFKDGLCEERTIRSCEIQSPFMSLEECSASCIAS